MTGPPENPGLLWPSKRMYFSVPVANENIDTQAFFTRGMGKSELSAPTSECRPNGKPRKYASWLKYISSVPGVSRRLGEIGKGGARTTMSTLPSAIPTTLHCNGFQARSCQILTETCPAIPGRTWRAVITYWRLSTSTVKQVPQLPS